ncbi:MAG: glycoside hydrolase family 127 protein [Proteobacteria bacterium]|nr:glycoside hydrolase family 127 protein [Pseudomonadota bacterium]
MADKASLPRPRGRTALKPFDYEGVRLLPSRFQAQVTRAIEVYGAIPNDDLLKGFRQAASLPAPGNGMRGWCTRTSAVIFGQLLSGLARMGRATGEHALWQKADVLLGGWQATLGTNGNIGMRPYDWEKQVCGLVDLHVYAGLPAALPILERATEWAARTFDRTRKLADNHDFWGAGPGATQEWYTLPENLYRAYLASGNALFREFADVWRYEDYWSQFAESAELSQVVAGHAYSHVNSFSSAAMAYAVTGEERYLRICVNAYDFLQRTQCYATGGFGPDERLMPPDGSLGRSLDLYAGHAEIPCGSWAATKLSRYLMSFTGEARFGDWIETILYNAMGAALPTEPDGRTYYYGDYRLSSGLKQFYWHEWPCCSGTYWQTVADYHNNIYFQDAEGIYVNLYVPSELSWRHHGEAVRLTQETRYPESETISLRVDLDRPTAFKLHLRVPGWSTGLSLALNGAALPVNAVPGRWATVEREWRQRDSLTITIPMVLRMTPVDRQHRDRVAISYGPVVLAQDEACCRRPFALEADTPLLKRLVRDGDRLRFNITDTAPERHRRFLQPLYEFPAFWPYWVYFDLSAPPLY